jgi:putative transposase
MMAGDELLLPRRRNPRLHGYDYATAGEYFVTACTHQRRLLFATIRDERVVPSRLGEIAIEEWIKTTTLAGVRRDAWVLMPNHFHAIGCLEPSPDVPRRTALATVVGQFKAATTRRARQWTQRGGRIWQRGFYDRIIRNDRELDSIREYIETNPARWTDDKHYLPLGARLGAPVSAPRIGSSRRRIGQMRFVPRSRAG